MELSGSLGSSIGARREKVMEAEGKGAVTKLKNKDMRIQMKRWERKTKWWRRRETR